GLYRVDPIASREVSDGLITPIESFVGVLVDSDEARRRICVPAPYVPRAFAGNARDGILGEKAIRKERLIATRKENGAIGGYHSVDAQWARVELLELPGRLKAISVDVCFGRTKTFACHLCVPIIVDRACDHVGPFARSCGDEGPPVQREVTNGESVKRVVE